jgi:glycosyltransferase involved in cell wall biosynthesis
VISIITPSFQQLDWLQLAIASVADQAGVNVEHLIHDAGTEGVKQMFDANGELSADAHHKAKLFIEKDSGMYDAINRGLRKAGGDICAYLNCDEQYLPGTFARVEKFFAGHPKVDVLFGDVVLVDADGQPFSYRRVVLPTRHHIRASHLSTLSAATFFRRSVLERGFYFDASLKDVGDAVWVGELLSARTPMATVPFPLAVFAFTGKNRSTFSFAQQEGAGRRTGSGSLGPLQRNAIILAHRIRKALAGAYNRRRVEIDIFTLKSPNRRQHFISENIGFRWLSRNSDET